jgi:mannose-6-phosphate isomerase-like protein (cupin superfamily)
MTHSIRRLALALAVATLCVAPLGPFGGRSSRAAPNRPGGVVIVKPSEVQWTDYPGRPGVKLAMLEGDLTKPGPFLMRVKFPANFKVAPHTHPGVEHTTILSGALRMGYGTRDGGPMETLTAGTVLITPAGTPHFLATTEETIVQTHGIGPWGSTPAK